MGKWISFTGPIIPIRVRIIPAMMVPDSFTGPFRPVRVVYLLEPSTDCKRISAEDNSMDSLNDLEKNLLSARSIKKPLMPVSEILEPVK